MEQKMMIVIVPLNYLRHYRATNAGSFPFCRFRYSFFRQRTLSLLRQRELVKMPGVFSKKIPAPSAYHSPVPFVKPGPA